MSQSRPLPRAAISLVSVFMAVVFVFWSPFVAPAFAVAQFHTVTFAQNDNGSDSTTETQTENAPTALTLFSALSPPFTNTGQTFLDWNTQPDGSGTTYSDGEMYAFNSPIVLYAIWSSQFHTVTFAENDNGGDSTTETQTENGPTALTLFSALSPPFTNTGHTFLDWNTEPDGSGTTFTNAEIYGFGSGLELYVIWQSTSNVTIAFDLNGGVGTASPVTGAPGSTETLPSGSGISKTGYEFSGWNTSDTGTGTEYVGGESLALSTNETLYAQWSSVSVVQPSPPAQQQAIEIGFDANGGSGSLSPVSGVAGAALTLPGHAELVRPGYLFTSWNTNADGTGTSYASGASVTLSSSLTLYAQWKAAPTAVLFGDVGVFDKNSTSLTKPLQRQIDQLAAAIRVKKYTKVALFGYTAQTGLDTLNAALSHDRAVSVAQYLRHELHDLHVKGVDISASGEGAISSSTSSLYSRVEVFVS